ncbi:MAG: N-acetylmuramoyl-L-alanine amidase [Bacteroidetes bacterium]|nr:N-acetylmuramoyl-L-alanine amidase [Bacteroidota bacterium]
MRIKLLLLGLVLISHQQLAFSAGKKITKIVLDAGHGGHDAGARGQYSNEKDLTLAIALRLGKIIRDSMKEVQVLYTRTSDIYPTLPERHEIANRANADLFISIHINATPGTYTREMTGYKTVKHGRKRVKTPVYRTIHNRATQANGTETYVLGLHRNSQKEDAIGEYGETVTQEPGLMNENDPQTAIIIAQYSQAFLSRSVSLGSKIQQEFANDGRKDMGVKQKGLEVLAGSAMPGVLVECGFINNPNEEAYMNSEAGQQQIALAIYRGIKAYKAEAER